MPTTRVDKSSLLSLNGVGPAIAKKLSAMGIGAPQDLLFHLPLRYQDRTRVQSISSLANGSAAVIEGEITNSSIVFGRRRSLICKLRDDSGSITLRFFHFSAAQKNQLANGTRLRCYGECSLGRGGLELIHPEYQLLHANSPAVDGDTLTAVYPSTEGMHQARWRKLIASAFALLDEGDVPELLQAEHRLQTGGKTADLGLYQALKTLHFPPVNIDQAQLDEGSHPLQRRLAFEELIAQRLSHLVLRKRLQSQQAIAIPADEPLENRFLQQLPFALTGAQQRVVDEIRQDLAKTSPMTRLLQGDVGSGKTVVAAIAALHAIGNGMQVALMAPTEILAEQHAQSMQQWLEPLAIRSGLLVSKMPAARKRQSLAAIANGEQQLVIGTHALIQSDVAFNNLGLVIIDEQHRFGVDQRLALKDKREDQLSVHQLVMTATPIPRTLAMTFYADLDLSVIDELPPGRTPVETVAIANDKRQQVIERVNSACGEGKQAYWVCTLIEDSEALQCQAAETTANELASALPGLRIALVHGRLKAEQKQQVMKAFKAGDVDLLVATTVIEVGVDVPNASLMIIENPERLGLSQLHQLRGRVGRGSAQSHCVLLYQKPLSHNARQRIEIMRETTNGFVLAEKDLKMRGPGEVLGKRQSGAAAFRLADLDRDADLLNNVVQVADKLLGKPQARALVQRWCPLAENYINV